MPSSLAQQSGRRLGVTPSRPPTPPTVRFRSGRLPLDCNTTDGERPAPPLCDAFHQIGSAGFEVSKEVSDLHAVIARTALVRDHGLVGPIQVRSIKYGFQINHLVCRLPVMLLLLRLSSDPSPTRPYPPDSVGTFRPVPLLGIFRLLHDRFGGLRHHLHWFRPFLPTIPAVLRPLLTSHGKLYSVRPAG
jgi:hypothetical protein